jgi:hypothetical protein
MLITGRSIELTNFRMIVLAGQCLFEENEPVSIVIKKNIMVSCFRMIAFVVLKVKNCSSEQKTNFS